jgi:hypothetical protein
MLEAVLPEAELLLLMGDRAAARQRIDPTLSALAASDIATLQSPVGAGLLLRAVRVLASLDGGTATDARGAAWLRAVAHLTGDSALLASARIRSAPVSDSSAR